MPSPRRPVLTALLAVSALGLTACGDQAGAAGTDPAPVDGKISIVTATNVYGAIATAVGGDDVEVTSIVDSLGQDPHSYEATVQDKLSVSEADLVIRNGGGYDTFLGRLAEEAGSVAVLEAVGLTGPDGAAADEHADEEHGDDEHTHDHGAFNEHVWYSLPAMVTVAGAIADELGRLDVANAEAYRERADAFTADLRPLQDRLAALASGANGRKVAVTEPVPVYLLEAAGLENVTPEEFSEAVEEETDVPVAALNEMKELVTGGQLAFLAYNGQTEGPQTEAVRSAADGAGLPVLEFTETLPDGDDYVSWMTANTDAVQAALAG